MSKLQNNVNNFKNNCSEKKIRLTNNKYSRVFYFFFILFFFIFTYKSVM